MLDFLLDAMFKKGRSQFSYIFLVTSFVFLLDEEDQAAEQDAQKRKSKKKSLIVSSMDV